MGNYRQSIMQAPSAPDITATRQYGRTKYGYGINVEQDLGSDVGVFARASWNDGRNETWAFTEIDRSISTGISIAGTNWHRSKDILGIGTVMNGLSHDHRDYLAAGGYGFIIGDGSLNYGNEWSTELYYNANLFSEHFFVTPDVAYVVNPAYNKDRGPAFITSVRAHVEF
jgi:high affinity Mn2+ porin